MLAGFKAGMGLVIAASQLGDADPATVALALALGGLAVLLGLRRWAPGVPGPLIVVVLGVAWSR